MMEITNIQPDVIGCLDIADEDERFWRVLLVPMMAAL
jgi:inorganic pyrophosphatase